jgi:hypothetical protein
MSSQYALIAEPWPELLGVAVRVEWIDNDDSQLQRPLGEPSLSQLIHASDFRLLVGPQLQSRFKLLKGLGNEAVHRAQAIPRKSAELAAVEVLVSPGGLQPMA